MQVFVPYPSPIEVAKCIDIHRLRKQILECNQILASIRGETVAWKNHPVSKMYSHYSLWLTRYRFCLLRFAQGAIENANCWSELADMVRPPFLTEEFCDQHKRRLYTKAPDLYPQFASYGTSEENWYVVDGKLLKYINGKQI